MQPRTIAVRTARAARIADAARTATTTNIDNHDGDALTHAVLPRSA
jgi:hypothetical protein